MNNIYFENAESVGNLYLDYIFYEFEKEPILFTCEDSRKRLFLCICSDIRYEQKWVIAPSSIAVLKALIEEKIDIASAFLKCPRVITVVMDRQGNESSRVIDVENLDRLDLPKEGTFARCDIEKAQNYLWRKECELRLLEARDFLGTDSIVRAVVHKSADIVLNAVLSTVMKPKEVYLDTFEKNGERQMEEQTAWEQNQYFEEERIQVEVSYVNTAESLNLDQVIDSDYIQAA